MPRHAASAMSMNSRMPPPTRKTDSVFIWATAIFTRRVADGNSKRLAQEGETAVENPPCQQGGMEQGQTTEVPC